MTELVMTILHIFLADRATDIIKQFLGSLCFDFELYVECSNLYVLLNYSTEDQKNIRRAVRQIFDELKQQEAILKGMEITAGMGRMTGCIGELRSSLLDARFMLQQRIIAGTGGFWKLANRGELRLVLWTVKHLGSLTETWSGRWKA
mgnify:FL=1